MVLLATDVGVIPDDCLGGGRAETGTNNLIGRTAKTGRGQGNRRGELQVF